MDRRLKDLLDKRMAFKRSRVSNSVEDLTPGTSSAMSTIAAASGAAGVQSSPQQSLVKKQLQELVAARARLQRQLDESAASAAARLKTENAKQAAAALAAASVPTPTAEEDGGVTDGDGKKKRKKKRNRKNKHKGGKEAKPEDPGNTEKEEDQDEGNSSDVAEKPSARSGPRDHKAAAPAVAAPAGKPAPNKKAVRDPANPIAYTSDLHYVDPQTGKLIPEKVAKMGYQDRRRIYADFLVPRVMLIHPALYDDIMDVMYKMPDKHIVQMIYSDYLLSEFASFCISDLQKVNYKLKRN